MQAPPHHDNHDTGGPRGHALIFIIVIADMASSLTHG